MCSWFYYYFYLELEENLLKIEDLLNLLNKLKSIRSKEIYSRFKFILNSGFPSFKFFIFPCPLKIRLKRVLVHYSNFWSSRDNFSLPTTN